MQLATETILRFQRTKLSQSTPTLNQSSTFILSFTLRNTREKLRLTRRTPVFLIYIPKLMTWSRSYTNYSSPFRRRTWRSRLSKKLWFNLMMYSQTLLMARTRWPIWRWPLKSVKCSKSNSTRSLSFRTNSVIWRLSKMCHKTWHNFCAAQSVTWSKPSWLVSKMIASHIPDKLITMMDRKQSSRDMQVIEEGLALNLDQRSLPLITKNSTRQPCHLVSRSIAP